MKKDKALSFAGILLIIIIILAIIIAALFLFLNTPTNGDGSGGSEYDALVDCTGVYLKDFAKMFDHFSYLLRTIDNPTTTITAPSGWGTYNPTTGDFGFTVYLDGTTADTTVKGTITNGSNTELSDGMQANEVARADWTMKEDGTEKGSGAFSFVKLDSNSYRMTIVKKTAFNRQETCSFEFTTFSLHLNVNQIQTGDPFNAVYTGTLDFETTKDAKPLTGMMTFDGSETATVSGNYDGEAYSLTFNLQTHDLS